MHDRAHRYCFIANSLADSVEVRSGESAVAWRRRIGLPFIAAAESDSIDANRPALPDSWVSSASSVPRVGPDSGSLPAK